MIFVFRNHEKSVEFRVTWSGKYNYWARNPCIPQYKILMNAGFTAPKLIFFLNFRAIFYPMKKQLLLLLCLSFIVKMVNAQFINNIIPYSWKSPKVQGHNINNAHFINDNRIIAVGDQGTILMSNDTGATWNIHQIPTISDFRAVCIADSMTYYVAAGVQNGRGQIYKTTDGGQQWDLLLDTLPVTFHAIHFPTDSIGYVAGRLGKILKTTNAGQSWTPLVTGNVANFVSIFFLNADTGYAGGENYGLYKTTNGGISWSLVNSFPQNNCYSLTFLNDTLGWAGSYSGKIFRTINGGLTWQQQLNQANFEEITQISFNSPTRGIAISDGYFYKTNNGTNWTATFAYAGMNMKCVALNSNSTIFIGGFGGGMRMAQNFSNTYTNPNLGFGLASNRCIRFTDPLNGWVCSDNGIMGRTSDGGNTWLYDTANFFTNLNDLAAISPQKAIAVGSNGEVVTTTNGLQTLTTQIMTSTNTLQAISFPTATTGYIAGLGGVMYKTVNGGSTWTSVNTGVTSDINDLHFINANVGFFLGQTGALKKTTNGGATWTDASPSFVFSPFYAMHWIDEFTGIISDNNGYVARTTNGGQNWAIVDTVCSGNSFDIMFVDANRGFMVGSSTNAFCDVSYTLDGGLTWDGLSLPYQYAINSIFAFDTSNFFLALPYRGIIQAGSTVLTKQKELPQPQQDSFVLFPNPSGGPISIQNLIPSPIARTGTLYDLGGRSCMNFSIPANTNQMNINLDHLEKGLYFLTINHQTQKIIIE
jgi:photosystem II stability/assembly factor-like uncharacterized protein